MDVSGLVSSASGLIGVLVGAALNGQAQARERRSREAADLRGALGEVLQVFEGMAFELRMQPRQRRNALRVGNWLSRHVPELDLPAQQIGINVAAGPFMVWVVSPRRLADRYDQLTAAITRLGQTSQTPSLIDHVQAALGLIGEFPATGGDDERAAWDARWRAAQETIATAGAEAVALLQPRPFIARRLIAAARRSRVGTRADSPPTSATPANA